MFDIVQQLPLEMIDMEDVPNVIASKERKMLFGVKIERKHLVERIGAKPGEPFDTEHYTRNPHEYRGRFHRDIAPMLSVLIHTMYWDARFPRLLTDEQVRE